MKKMKNVNIMGIHQFLGEEGVTKKQYIYGWFPKKEGLDNLQGVGQK